MHENARAIQMSTVHCLCLQNSQDKFSRSQPAALNPSDSYPCFNYWLITTITGFWDKGVQTPSGQGWVSDHLRR